MRKARIVVRNQTAFYHCISKTVNGEFLFREMKNKEIIRRILWRVAYFSGVEILTYCLMDNHFHLLIKVPDQSKIKLSDAEIIDRYTVLYSVMEPFRTGGKAVKYAPLTVSQVRDTLNQGGESAKSLRQQLLTRMHDLSEFMKTFKQRVTMWYNETYQRFGPLWFDRFHSVLVQGKRNVLLLMAGYIDLNPIRAGMTKDPADYLFCGFGEAILRQSGNARLGIAFLCGYDSPHPPGDFAWEKIRQTYRAFLEGRGLPSIRNKSGPTGDPPDDSPGIPKNSCPPNKPKDEKRLIDELPELNNGLLCGDEGFVAKNPMTKTNPMVLFSGGSVSSESSSETIYVGRKCRKSKKENHQSTGG